MATVQPEMNPVRVRTIVRCLPAGGLLLLGAGLLCLVQMTEFSFTPKPTRDFQWIIIGTEVAIYLWVRLCCRLTLRQQLAALAVLYGVQLIPYFAIRSDGFTGDGRPILAWSWAPSRDSRWSHYEAIEPPREAQVVADLATTTDVDYPAFRGGERTGTVRAIPIAREWIEPPRQLWRHPVGLGWSSFAVVGDYCVTQEQRGEYETVVCYELRTGHEVWTHADETCFEEITSGKGPRATPTIHNGHVFALGATGILNCLEGADGRRVWSVNILEDNEAENALFGMCGSPLVLNGLVVVNPGGAAGSLVAYDEQTGERVWSGGKAAASYSSPQYADFRERPQVLNFNADGISGHDASNGVVLWHHPWVSQPNERNNVCQPVVLPGDGERPNAVFISSGYGQGCAVLELIETKGRFEVRERWRNRNLRAKFSSVVRRDRHIYGLDNTILACIDLDTGDCCWKGGRYGYGQLVLADDLLIVQAESGDVALVEATPEQYHERAIFPALDQRTWNHPVVCGDMLLVRNDQEAACYRLPRAGHR